MLTLINNFTIETFDNEIAWAIDGVGWYNTGSKENFSVLKFTFLNI